MIKEVCFPRMTVVLYHCSDILDENVRQQFCPGNGSGWCNWQNDYVNNTKTFSLKVNFPVVIKRLIEPIFCGLSSEFSFGKMSTLANTKQQ